MQLRELENLIEEAGYALITTRLDRKVKSWNKSAERMYGWKAGEVVDKKIPIIPANSLQEFEKILKRVKEGCVVSGIETLGVKKNKKKVNVRVTFAPMLDRKGNIAGIYEIHEDISEKKALERKIKKRKKGASETSEYLRRLIDTSPTSIISTDLKGRIISFNKTAEKIYGYKEREVLGKHASILQPEKVSGDVDRDTINKEIYRQTMKKDGWDGEFLNMRKNGEIFPIYLRTRRLLDDGGRTIGLMSVALDITERKKMENELNTYTKQLEFYSTQLENYANKLMRSNELKDLFIDIMRHDLLNPIGIIKIYTEMLLEEKGKEELKAIKRNTEKLIEMIETASTLAKLQSEEEIKFEKKDLNAVFRKVIESIRPTLDEKGMKLEYNVEGKYVVKVNKIIEDVFANLLTNAIKYSPANGKIRVWIEDLKSAFRINVQDWGEGIPDTAKENIFNRFERGGKEGVKGTGLGLAIVKRGVEIHHGKVWVDDNPEGGSIFRIVLPKS